MGKSAHVKFVDKRAKIEETIKNQAKNKVPRKPAIKKVTKKVRPAKVGNSIASKLNKKVSKPAKKILRKAKNYKQQQKSSAPPTNIIGGVPLTIRIKKYISLLDNKSPTYVNDVKKFFDESVFNGLAEKHKAKYEKIYNNIINKYNKANAVKKIKKIRNVEAKARRTIRENSENLLNDYEQHVNNCVNYWNGLVLRTRSKNHNEKVEALEKQEDRLKGIKKNIANVKKAKVKTKVKKLKDNEKRFNQTAKRYYGAKNIRNAKRLTKVVKDLENRFDQADIRLKKVKDNIKNAKREPSPTPPEPFKPKSPPPKPAFSPINPSEIQITIYDEPKKTKPPSPKPKSPSPLKKVKKYQDRKNRLDKANDRYKKVTKMAELKPKVKKLQAREKRFVSANNKYKRVKELANIRKNGLPKITINALSPDQIAKYFKLLYDKQIDQPNIRYIPYSQLDLMDATTYNKFIRGQKRYDFEKADEVWLTQQTDDEKYWKFVRLRKLTPLDYNVVIYDPFNGTKLHMYKTQFENAVRDFLSTLHIRIKGPIKYVDCPTSNVENHTCYYVAEFMRRVIYKQSIGKNYDDGLLYRKINYELQNNKLVADDYIRHLIKDGKMK